MPIPTTYTAKPAAAAANRLGVEIYTAEHILDGHGRPTEMPMSQDVLRGYLSVFQDMIAPLGSRAKILTRKSDYNNPVLCAIGGSEMIQYFVEHDMAGVSILELSLLTRPDEAPVKAFTQKIGDDLYTQVKANGGDALRGRKLHQLVMASETIPNPIIQ